MELPRLRKDAQAKSMVMVTANGTEHKQTD
jgi:hypothetical protein